MELMESWEFSIFWFTNPPGFHAYYLWLAFPFSSLGSPVRDSEGDPKERKGMLEPLEA